MVGRGGGGLVGWGLNNQCCSVLSESHFGFGILFEMKKIFGKRNNIASCHNQGSNQPNELMHTGKRVRTDTLVTR